MPDIVVEVVSPTSRRRDYGARPADYLAAGVREYWIVDPDRKSAQFRVRQVDRWVVHRRGRRGKWNTGLLFGFTLDLAKVFARSPRSS